MGRRGWLGTRAGERGTTGRAHRVPQTGRGRAASVVRRHRVPHCARQNVQADLIIRDAPVRVDCPGDRSPSVAHVATIRPPAPDVPPGDPRQAGHRHAASGEQAQPAKRGRVRSKLSSTAFVSVQSPANWRCQRLRRLLGEASSSRCRRWVWIGVISAWSRSRSWCSCWSEPQAANTFLMPAISAWHPSWREELWSSLAREPHATCVHESQTPPFADQLGVGALPQGELLAPKRRPFVGAVNRTDQGIKSPTAPPQRSSRSGHRRGTTGQTGYVNRNEQEVVLATGFPDTDHGQSVYVLRGGRCGHEYGSNGSDNFQRKCPECQDGAPGASVVARSGPTNMFPLEGGRQAVATGVPTRDAARQDRLFRHRLLTLPGSTVPSS